LDRSAEGKSVSTYHLEAGIAWLHCSSPSYTQTNWKAILQLYDALMTIQPSPIYLLNRAIVIAEIEGPQAGIHAIESAARLEDMRNYHLLDMTIGELHRRAGDFSEAIRHFKSARLKTNSPPDHDLIDRRIAECS
jgi:RNA polymerase sigma-70 factor (ECF subfamily)